MYFAQCLLVHFFFKIASYRGHAGRKPVLYSLFVKSISDIYRLLSLLYPSMAPHCENDGDTESNFWVVFYLIDHASSIFDRGQG